MNEKELYAELKKIGLPVAYREFKRVSLDIFDTFLGLRY